MKYLLLFLPLFSFSQNSDSVFVSDGYQVSFRSIQLITAGDNKVGDTLRCFATDDNVKVSGVIAIEKGALVTAIIVESSREHKVAKEDKHLEEGFVGLLSPGKLIIDFISVKAIDGTDVPLGDCRFIRHGGDNGGLPKHAPATVDLGILKVCKTKYPGVKIGTRKP